MHFGCRHSWSWTGFGIRNRLGRRDNNARVTAFGWLGSILADSLSRIADVRRTINLTANKAGRGKSPLTVQSVRIW